MIAWLQGKIIEKRPPVIVLDVQGVGYELEAPMTTFYDLPAEGKETSVYTHLVVREDAQLLYGFSTASQRDMFRNLLRVSGVGPRVGLAILSGLTADDFLACILHEDISRLTMIPGIGKKTAQRLVVEMKDRLEKELDGAVLPRMAATGVQAEPDTVHDAVAALIALGYKPAESSRVVREAAGSETGETELSSEELIRRALKSLSGSDA